jgi:hypothetical protein
MGDSLLVLKHDDLARRLQDLYGQLSESRSFREYFVKDPSSLIASTVFSGYRDVSAARINQANRLLFSLLSNARFMEWSEEFQNRVLEEAQEIVNLADPVETAALLSALVDKNRLYREIADAMLEFGDKELIFSLTVSDAPEREPRVSEVDVAAAIRSGDDNVFPIVTFVLFVIVAALVIPLWVAPPPGMEVGVGLSRQDLQSVSNFLVDRLTARAQEIRDSGVLTSFEGTKRGPVL